MTLRSRYGPVTAFVSITLGYEPECTHLHPVRSPIAIPRRLDPFEAIMKIVHLILRQTRNETTQILEVEVNTTVVNRPQIRTVTTVAPILCLEATRQLMGL